ncbi:hypothetical protein VU13_00085, partial [Desulfobulbus sp. US5]|nr:hypothetical protein [Desulfobulbus sp. US5]
AIRCGGSTSLRVLANPLRTLFMIPSCILSAKFSFNNKLNHIHESPHHPWIQCNSLAGPQTQ